jgi:hydroxyacylglutathione hydrolase
MGPRRRRLQNEFLYLLIGTQKALLIDTGAVADPARMPVAKTVMDLLSGQGKAELPLIVVHSHGHRDHIACARASSRSPRVL